MKWHFEEINHIVNKFHTNLSEGLSEKQLLENQRNYSKNVIPDCSKKKITEMIFDQFSDFMIIVLIFASILSLILKEFYDAAIILLIILINGTIGILQEFKAEKSLQALKKILTPFCNVIRNGKIQKVQTKDLTLGDLVVLEAGEQVPADLRIVFSNELTINESNLTGESTPVLKRAEKINKNNLQIADQKNIAFKSTLITRGKGRGIVVEVGTNTEIGKIAKILQKQKRNKTPLQKRLNLFTKKITFFLFTICIIFFLTGIAQGKDIFFMLMTSLSLAVAAIPEALPTVITLTLAQGAHLLAKKKSLVQTLPAVEGLGSIEVICSDKTGTLTQNKMKVVDLFTQDKNNYPKLLEAIYLNHDLNEKANYHTGDPTEIALYEFSKKKLSLIKQKKLSDYERIYERPFNSKSKSMITIHRKNDHLALVIKGAPEKIFQISNSHNSAKEKAVEMAEKGQRVIAYAMKEIPLSDFIKLEKTNSIKQYFEKIQNLLFLGVVGIEDPPRKDVKNSILNAKKAGVSTVMITGDHPLTALSIAKQVGLIESIKQEDKNILTGNDIELLSQNELDKKVLRTIIFARCSPSQKIKIVQSLQKNKKQVAMTGDGVNDAPALKRADIGIAMGLTGSQVAREAADIVLLDDNYSTIVDAIFEGRRILNNIKKFIIFALTGNLGEIISVILSPLFNIPIPLLPLHILWTNIVTDGLPGLALAYEKGDNDLLNQRPLNKQENLLDTESLFNIFFYGGVVGFTTILSAIWGYTESKTTMYSMSFFVLNISQLILLQENRFRKASIFNYKKIKENMFLHISFFIGFLIIILSIYTDFGNKIFKISRLNNVQLLKCFFLCSLIIVLKEIQKFYIRKKYN